jgi:integrase
VRLFGGQDPVTGTQVMLTVAAEDGDSAIKLRDKFRRQVADATAARTSVTLGYLFDEWLAGDQVEETPRTSYRVAIEKFLKPAVGETSLTRLAQLGTCPFEQLYAELRVAGGAARAGRSSSTGVSGA